MYPVKKNSYSKLIWVSQMLISSSVCQVDHYWQYKNLPSKVTMKHIYTYLYLLIITGVQASGVIIDRLHIYIYLSSYSMYMSFLYNITQILQD